MPRKSTSSKASSAAATPEPATVTKTASAAPSKKRSAPKKKVVVETTTTSAPIETTPTPAPVAVPVSAPESEIVEVTPLQQIDQGFTSLNSKLSEFKSLYASINTDLRALQKNIQRYMKDSSKRNRRNKNTDPNRPKRPPSGFAKPALISSALCNFLGKPEGTEMARTEVTKHLTQYIKTNSLQDQENRRKIVPDAALKKLLNVKDSDEVTYFNLQKYMKVHFPKSASASS